MTCDFVEKDNNLTKRDFLVHSKARIHEDFLAEKSQMKLRSFESKL